MAALRVKVKISQDTSCFLSTSFPFELSVCDIFGLFLLPSNKIVYCPL